MNTTQNNAGGLAYQKGAEEALYTVAMTSTGHAANYGQQAIGQINQFAPQCSDEYLGKLAVYASERGKMRDMPVYLLTVLLGRKTNESREVARKIAPLVLRTGKDIRTFCQMMRSGAFGRKSLGKMPKRLVQEWFDRQTADQILRNSIGQKPSLKDVLNIAHPRPHNPEVAELFHYLKGKPVDRTKLNPKSAFSKLLGLRDGTGTEVPNLPIEFLFGLSLSPSQWCEVVEHLSPLAITRNLAGFVRKQLSEDPQFCAAVRTRMEGADLPIGTIQSTTRALEALGVQPEHEWVRMLNQKMREQCRNIPSYPVNGVAVAVDTSGSMTWSLTGSTKSTITCSRQAAMIAMLLLWSQPKVQVVPFDTQVYPCDVSPDLGINQILNLIDRGGGGTDCAAPIRHLNSIGATDELVIMISDSESWGATNGRDTPMMKEWQRYVARVPNARLVAIDLQPNQTTQTLNHDSILRVAGWNTDSLTLIGRWMDPEYAETSDPFAVSRDAIEEVEL